MGYRGRAFAEEHYDWDKLAEKLATRLAQICAHHRKGKYRFAQGS